MKELTNKTTFIKDSKFNLLGGDPADKIFSEIHNQKGNISQYLSREKEINYEIKQPSVKIHIEEKVADFCVCIEIEFEEESKNTIYNVMKNLGYSIFSEETTAKKNLDEKISHICLLISQGEFPNSDVIVKNDDLIIYVEYAQDNEKINQIMSDL